MNHKEYYFNFFIGQELDACGELIYKGFESLMNNDVMVKENDVLAYLNQSASFVFLLHSSIAFERLGKIVVLFLLNDSYPEWTENHLAKFKKSVGIENHVTESDDFEIDPKMDENIAEQIKTALFGHSNVKLYELINVLEPKILQFNSDERRLMNDFDEFYKKYRYGNFNPINIDDYTRPAQIVNELLIKFWSKTKRQITTPPFSRFTVSSVSEKDEALTKLGEVMKTMLMKYFNFIEKSAFEMNIYTYELNYDNPSAIHMN